MTLPPPRSLLRGALEAGLAAVGGRRVVAGWLAAHPLSAGTRLLALGKAAGAMAEGALEEAGGALDEALVVSKHGHPLPPLGRLPGRTLSAGHPVPDADSLAAGQAVLDLLARAPAGAPFLVLLSGGASALVEASAPGVTLDTLLRVNRYLLGSGLPIDAVNRVRQRLSRLKGGRLGALLAGHPTRVLAISDVPGDDPRLIASGPFTAPAADPLPPLPGWLEALCAEAPPAPTPAELAHVELHLVARLEDALAAAAQYGEDLGLATHRHRQPLAGDAAERGLALGRALRSAAPGLHLWGGETTVTLPEHPGRGGRNQHLALAAAMALEGSTDLCLLAAGSDGSDGPTADAGALVDGGTLARGRAGGLDPAACLAAADAGRFLDASGDLVTTGPTGTNVMDLVLAYRRA
jgi:glycerate 2-kinase